MRERPSIKQGSSSTKSISLTIPCYNEERNLRNVLDSASVALELLGMEYEIVIVNDGSTDKTGELADEAARTNPRVRVIHHAENRGYGAALRSGLNSASTDVAGYIDGDGQFDAREIHSLIPYLDDYDIVSGRRKTRNDPFHRQLMGRLWSWLMRKTLRISVEDINSGLKIYRRTVLANMQLQSDGAFIDAEIFARANRLGFSVKEVEVSHYPRASGKQTGANVRVILRAFRELVRLRSSI